MRSALLFILAACATTPRPPVHGVVCELDIELLSEPYTGRASSPNDARKTLNEAREQACAALKAAPQIRSSFAAARPRACARAGATA